MSDPLLLARSVAKRVARKMTVEMCLQAPKFALPVGWDEAREETITGALLHVRYLSDLPGIGKYRVNSAIFLRAAGVIYAIYAYPEAAHHLKTPRRELQAFYDLTHHPMFPLLQFYAHVQEFHASDAGRSRSQTTAGTAAQFA